MGQRVRARLPGRLREVLGEASDEDVLILSAGLAFYALVSVVPLTILVLWLTSLAAGDAWPDWPRPWPAWPRATWGPTGRCCG
jgi:uncharacterized BrkB/YihY/UPF0761 family membrane protein